MKKVSRESWIQAGFQMLDQFGYTQLSAEKIARRLNVTRGSFYHHFRSRADFVDALLVRWREDYTDEVIAQARAEEPPQLRLERYLSVAGRLQPGREVAIRAWAARDRNVRAVLEETDASRLEFVQHLGRDMFPRAGALDVLRFARVACLAFIGFQQTGPHGRERFVELVQDVMDIVGPRDATQVPVEQQKQTSSTSETPPSDDGQVCLQTPRFGSKAAAFPIAPPQSAAAPARTPPPAGHPESGGGHSR